MDGRREGMIELFHGYTYSGHPLACAAALATLNVYRDEGLYEKAAQLEEPVCRRRAQPSGRPFDRRGHPHLRLVAGIDITPIEGKPTARAFAAMQDAFHNQDMMIRVTGDTIALSPPLTFTESEIDQMFAGLKRRCRRCPRRFCGVQNRSEQRLPSLQHMGSRREDRRCAS
jgi:beta-alanine--pyruvate transaminase